MPSKIKKRGANSYMLTVSAGYNPDGSQKTYTKTIQCDNLTEAKKQYNLFASETLQGKVLESGTERMTLDGFYQYWTKHHAEKNQELSTQVHNDNLYVRIKAALGHLRIDKIQPKHILTFIDQLNGPTVGKGDKPLSPTTIKKHYILLNSLLTTAVQWEMIIANPCEKVTPPKQVKTHKDILSEEELATFLNALNNHNIVKHQLWIMLAFTLGLRREEIFGLKWQDINFSESTISIARAIVYVQGVGLVEKDTKSDSSYRTLSVPPDVMQLLVCWQEEVEATYKRRNKRNKVVALTNPTALDKWIFTQANGTVAHPHSFNTFISRFCKDNGLEKISPHLLRHMSGSYLLKAGIDIAGVSKKLGHGDKSFTMKTYIHSLESTEKQTANVMQEILNNLKMPQIKKGQAK